MAPSPAIIATTPIGVIALADGAVKYRKLFDGDAGSRAERFAKALEGEVIEEVREAVSALRDGSREIAVAPSTLLTNLAKEYPDLSFREVDGPLCLERLFAENGLVSSVEEYRRLVKEVMDRIVTAELKEAVARRDMMIVHAVHILEDLDKQINMFYTRCREWFGLNFPELADLVDDLEQYMRIVAEFGSRRNMTEERLREIVGPKKAREIMEKAASSVGADLSPEDEERVKEVAREGLRLVNLRKEQERYLEELMSAEAPNLAAIAGPILGAKLISMAGGLEKLARLPASTIQVLGAEKALFRFFRTGRGAPKHGVIFQHPYIHGSPRWQRGKIARLLATKIALAARIDYFSREDRSGELRKSLEERLAEIKKKYAQPPPKKHRKPSKKGKRKKGKKRK
ncbi:MAG: hypothetical protein J7J94_02220 [Thaumarchaeota archaeon]|nr:hypothetical protein [Nitrososphaerota archaeon]